MAKCSFCNKWIIGGVRDGEHRYCDNTCLSNGRLHDLALQIPDDAVTGEVLRIHQGNCPCCGRRGPVDVHESHYVWSALLMTSWKSTKRVSCASCGKKENLKGFFISLFAGWWGFPWGLVMTPVMIIRNLWTLFSHQDALRPSTELVKLVRLDMARTLARDSAAAPQVRQ